jgi:diguanylate cyclase (GGDEF)-like protein
VRWSPRSSIPSNPRHRNSWPRPICAIVRARLSDLLTDCQYEVAVAATGQEALCILDTSVCHIVVTDWQMPDMDGLELCRHVRLRDPQRSVHLIMLTIRNAEGDRLAAYAAGADDYIVKGATMAEILARLEIGRRLVHGADVMRMGRPAAVRAAARDAVAGAHDAAYFVQHLAREFARSQRYGHALSVLDCRIEGLPEARQRFGQASIDRWLQAFAERSWARIRQGDWFARTGAEEFMFVLPETGARGAHHVAEKLHRMIALHPLAAFDGLISFTAEIGVTALDTRRDLDCTLKINALLRRAERDRHSDARYEHAPSGALN